jgi:hypothetical protein
LNPVFLRQHRDFQQGDIGNHRLSGLEIFQQACRRTSQLIISFRRPENGGVSRRVLTNGNPNSDCCLSEDQCHLPLKSKAPLHTADQGTRHWRVQGKPHITLPRLDNDRLAGKNRTPHARKFPE